MELDPASWQDANARIQATRIGDDNSRQPWSGRVYVNPPDERGLRVKVFLWQSVRSRE